MDSKVILKQTVEQPFNEGKFRQFIADFLNDYRVKQSSLFSFYPAFSDHINGFNLLGEYQDPRGKEIHILEVELRDTHKLEYARTTQRNLIAKYLEDNWLDGALVGFWAPDSPHWRFSFVKLAWEFDKENKKTKKILSPAKRYSFLIGEGEPSHTAQSQLLPVLEREQNPVLEQVEETFSVERITKEFFTKYKKLFDKLCQELDKNRIFIMLKETKRIDTANFAKKLLGQIVFLYFIQKKGWLGVAMDKKWGEGNRAFLRHLFEKAKEEERNFFNDYLEVLFYDTLNKKSDLPGSFYRKYFDSQIPFLNGGLFEPMKGYDWENSLLCLDNSSFSNDEGTGILDVFDRYNFTVKEDEPLEKEVAIDPEMLGKVFENLLEENLRKGKGTYYTPREIGHYMCRESLINYLASESKMDPEDIRKYFAFMESATPIVDGYEENFEKLDVLLKNIRVCDPACGSGAFLVGMLQDIVKLRLFLQNILGKKEKLSEYQLKKETIQNCIYGVDIDPGAVEIAKLRLWLSLVVDYELEEIEPLPNLDYKIMQGNSLLEELVLGDTTIKLFNPNLVISEKKKMQNLFEEEKQKDLFEQQSSINKVMEQLDELRKRYFKISDLSEKLELKKRIEDIEQNLVEQCVDKEIKVLESQLKNIGQYIAPGIGLTHRDAEKIAKTISLQAKIKQMWREFRETGTKPFFLWYLYFADVFQEKGGFDVVVGNPPYISAVQESKSDKDLREIYRRNYKLVKGAFDVYVIFLIKGVELTNKKGSFAWIIPNKFLVANYAENAFRYLKESGLYSVVNVSLLNVFETSNVYPIIILGNKLIRRFNHYEIEALGDLELGKLRQRPVTRQYQTFKDFKIRIASGATGFQAKQLAQCISENPTKESIPFIVSGSIDPYYIKFKNVRYMKKTYIRAFIRKGDGIAKTKWDFWKKEKIIIAGMTKRMEATYSVRPLALGVGVYAIYDYGKFNPKFLLAILNSKFLSHYLNVKFKDKHLAGGYLAINKSTIEQLPIVPTDSQKQRQFITLADKILNITKDDDYLENPAKQAQVREYQNQIDQLVYKLYGLTPEEIKIVENYYKK